MTVKAKSVCADKVKCGRGHLIKNQPVGRISTRLEWTHKYFCMGAVGGDESRSTVCMCFFAGCARRRKSQLNRARRVFPGRSRQQYLSSAVIKKWIKHSAICFRTLCVGWREARARHISISPANQINPARAMQLLVQLLMRKLGQRRLN